MTPAALPDDGAVTRRPLRSRDTRWAAALARGLAKTGVAPNRISEASVVCAAAACACLLAAPRADLAWRCALDVIAAASIQLRLLCNLLDGMVAIEGGRGTKSGVVWNDLPDRVADVLIFVGAGYGVPQVASAPWLGWAAALVAVMTAYVRLLGGASGAAQSFIGPMAKPQRMALMTAACLLAAVESSFEAPPRALPAALALVVVLGAVTAARRTIRIVRELESR